MNKYQLCAMAQFKVGKEKLYGYITSISYDHEEQKVTYTIETSKNVFVVDENDIVYSRFSALDYVNQIMKEKKGE